MAGISLSFSEVSWLNNELPSDIKLGGLLFDTSKDGCSHPSYFHDRCDGEGPTGPLWRQPYIGVMLGAYTDVSRSSSISWATDTDAFVFRLRPSPEKFKVSSSNYAICRHSHLGPTFGNRAIPIESNCRYNAESYVGSW